MIADFDPIPTPQPASGPTSFGRRSPQTPTSWRSLLPTLEGWPRFPPSRTWPVEDEPDFVAEADDFAAESVAPSSHDGSPPVAGDDDFLLRLYFGEIAREPRLAPDEELDLGWRCSFGDEAARRRLVLGNLRLVVHIAFEYRGLGLPLADLINEGNLGLWRATEVFKPTHGLQFSNYGGAWVRQRMRRALSSQARPMRLPANFAWQHGRVREAEARLRARLGSEPENREVAAECGFSLATVIRLRSAGFPKCLSLESPPPDDEGGPTLAEALPDENALSPDEEFARRGDQELARRLVNSLGAREQRVLRLRFGFEDGRQRTLEEVGRALGYVRQTIHQIESAALAKLRLRARRILTPGPAAARPNSPPRSVRPASRASC